MVHIPVVAYIVCNVIGMVPLIIVVPGEPYWARLLTALIVADS